MKIKILIRNKLFIMNFRNVLNTNGSKKDSTKKIFKSSYMRNILEKNSYKTDSINI